MTTIKAVGSERDIDLNAIGVRTVLIFHGQDTADAAQKVNQAVRAVPEFQGCDNVTIASVIDLHSVPKLFRKVATRSMRGAYDKASQELPPGERAQDYIIILPDWDGSATASFGFHDTGKTEAVAVLAADGSVIGTHQGSDAASAALQLLRQDHH